MAPKQTSGPMRDNRAWLLVADQTSDAQATNVKIILLCDSLLGKTNCSNQAWLLKNSFLVQTAEVWEIKNV